MQVAFLFASFLWTAIWWAIAWSRIPLFSEYSFFPLWVGYTLVMNAICEVLFLNSLIRRLRFTFLLLFVTSVPSWWFFEYLNSFVQNWHYLYRPVSELHFILQSSVDFSTVIPAVLSTGFLCQQLFAQHGTLACKKINITFTSLVIMFAFGVVSFPLMVYFPSQTFPLVWVAPFLILDPINYALKFPSILRYIQAGKWLAPVSIMAATLFTGLFWEMWNFYSYPKWFYVIPYVGFWKIFEMPVLGYGGYLFFGLIIWSFTALFFSVLGGTELLKRAALFTD